MLVTTFATTPILHFIAPKEKFLVDEGSFEPAAKLRLVHPLRQGILVPVSNPEKVKPLLENRAFGDCGRGFAASRCSVCTPTRRWHPVGTAGTRIPHSAALASSFDCP